MIAGLVVVAVLAQDPITTEAKFRAVLERAEKAGLTVPDLPDAAVELGALILTPNLPKDLRHRYETVRAQANVLSSLHALLLKHKGALFDVAIGEKPPINVKIVDVHKRGVKLFRAEAIQDVAFAELSPEWVLVAAGRPDSSLDTGLWFAKAARWESAFLAFGSSDTDHPLAVEARKRGVEAAASSLESMIRGKRWTEAIARLDALDKLAPGEERLKTARGKLLDAIMEHGKELCRKKSKGPMKDIIDLITKHFPDGADRIEDIREADRWIKVTDPKKFRKLEAAKGPPWGVVAPDDGARTMYWTEATDSFVGISVKVRFDKGAKSQAGFVWEFGKRTAWLSADTWNVCVASGNPNEYKDAYNWKKVASEGPHTIVLRLRGGHYVLQYNGMEYDRVETRESSLGEVALNACYGKAWFDEVLLLKKE